MPQHQLTIRRQPHVDLNSISALSDPCFHRSQRVLIRTSPSAPMTKHHRAVHRR